MKYLTGWATLLALALVQGPAAGQDCSGDRGFVLDHPSTFDIGSEPTLTLSMPSGGPIVYVASLGGGPTPSPFGDLCVSFPALAVFPLSIPRTGTLQFSCQIPCDRSIVGVKVYSQFVGFPSDGSLPGRSNGTCIEFLDADCDVVTLCPEDAIVDHSVASGTDHAVRMFGCIDDDVDLVFLGNGQRFMEYPDGTAKLTGTLVNTQDAQDLWCLDVCFSGRVNPGDVGYPPVGGSPKLELDSDSYVANNGPIDPDTWHYYTVVDGTMTGKGDNVGCLIQIERRGPAFQVGDGASGQNHNYGASTWFDAELDCPHAWEACTGDINIDLNPCPRALLETGFAGGPDGFSYVDDCFRATNAPAYCDGVHQANGGFVDGALEVTLGGLDDADILNMSGGWTIDFDLADDTEVTLSFLYELTMTSEYESDEYAQFLLSLDGVLIGNGSNDYLAQIAGNGNGGSATSTGWVSVELDLGLLPAGTHTLALGGFNNKKTLADESTVVRIDDVVLLDMTAGN